MRRRPRGPARFAALMLVAALLAGGLWAADRFFGRRGAPAPGGPDAAAAPPRGPFDVIIAGGTVYDGTGGPPRRADVAIQGDRIAYVGDLAGAVATRRLNAAGMAVAPGFIDVHSHTYEYNEPFALAAVMQGITTQIGGVDGRHHGYAAGGGTARPHKIADALADIERQGTGVNQAIFAGFGTLRGDAIGYGDVKPTAEKFALMKSLLQEAMQQGALGLSTGLDYVPDRFAPTDEIIEMAKVAAQAGGIYVSHVREDYRDVRVGVEEALRIGRAANIPVGIQHFKFVGPKEWAAFDAVVDLLNQARAAGQRLTLDVYSYQAPDWATRMTVTAALAEAGSPDLVEINVSPRAAGLVGKTLAGAARERGTQPGALAQQLTAEGARATPMLIQTEQMLRLLQLDYALTDSDGEAAPRTDPARALLPADAGVHPRSYGTYPRFLRLNRERNALPLPALIRKMTGAAADFYQLKDRGYVRPGAFADLAVFDPGQVRERATFSAPQEYPEGILHVLVNGQVAVVDGQPQHSKAGRALRRGQ